MIDTVTLGCLCGRQWETERCRGQYPSQCPGCARLQWHARRIAGRARRHQIPDVTVARDGRGVWRVTARTPFHGRPVVLHDLLDVDYLAAELAYRRVQPARQQLRETA